MEQMPQTETIQMSMNVHTNGRMDKYILVYFYNGMQGSDTKE